MNRFGLDLDQLDFSKGDGLLTVITQDACSGVVLMQAYADREALEHTLATGFLHYHSRSRGLWKKGETSGNLQRVVSLQPDCDRDALLACVISAGPACHTGMISCFGPGALAPETLARLDATLARRAVSVGEPGEKQSYTQRLLGDRNTRLKKLGEETTEFAIACADGDTGRAVEEAADLLYHVLVALRAVGAGWSDVRGELERRSGAGDAQAAFSP